jgi:CBS domain-containing protein
MEVFGMGLLGTLVSFGAGYVAGMRIGDRPVVAARGAVDQARSRASEMRARTLGAIGGGRAGTIDVRSVRDVMTTAPETIDVGASLRDAATIMRREDIGSVIVTENDAIAGIVTDRDIALRAVAAGRDPSTTVADVMTRSPATIEPTATVQEAIEVMREHDVRRVPVAEGGRAIGVVSLGDVSMISEARSVLADISTAPPNN